MRMHTLLKLSQACRFYHEPLIPCVRSLHSTLLMHNVIGIDVGSINTRAVIMCGGQNPRILEMEEGRAMPSVVAINPPLTGRSAQLHALCYPKDVFFNVMQLIGTNFNDESVQRLKSMVPFNIIKGPKKTTLIEYDGKTLSPTHLLASLLSRINALAKMYLVTSDPIKAVIAVPRDFTDRKKKEVEPAVRTAGFDLISIIDQSIVAANFCHSRKDFDVIVVSFGGQIHLSSVWKSYGKLFVQEGASDPFFGGRDFDMAIFEYILEEIKRKYEVNLSEDKVARFLLMDEAERAKIVLSSAEQVKIEVYHLDLRLRDKPAIILTRSKFETLVDHLVEKVKILCLSTFNHWRISYLRQEVILVGGMTKIPIIQHTIKSFFNRQVNKRWDPLEVVAFGAALEGAFVMEDQRKLSSDKIRLSLGFEDSNGKFRRMINRGATIPTTAKSCISTTCETQKSLCIRVFQGEHRKALFNDALGKVILSRLPPLPVGFTFNLVFEITKEGVLNVSLGNECSGVSIKSFKIPNLSQDNTRDKVMEALFSNMESWGFYEVEQRKWEELVLSRANMVLQVKAHLEDSESSYVKPSIYDLREAIDSRKSMLAEESSGSVERSISAVELYTKDAIESDYTDSDAFGYSDHYNDSDASDYTDSDAPDYTDSDDSD